LKKAQRDRGQQAQNWRMTIDPLYATMAFPLAALSCGSGRWNPKLD